MLHKILNVTKNVVMINELMITIPANGLSRVINEAEFRLIQGPRFDIKFIPVMMETAAPATASTEAMEAYDDDGAVDESPQHKAASVKRRKAVQQ